MKDRDKTKEELSKLRRRAELAVEKSMGISDVSALAPGKVQQLIHELQVHQVELEMQNEELRESEALYRDLVENIEDLVCKHDLQGNLIFVNSSSANLLGYGSAELVGTNLRSYLAPEVRDQFDAYLATVQRDGCASGLMLIQTKTGEKRIWEYRNTLGKESVPAPIVLGIARDVTDRKRAEHELRESERKYKELADNANSAIIRWKRDGTLTFFNEYAQAFFGYSAHEAVGNQVGILVPERDSTGGDLSTLLQNIVNHPQRYVNNINENICRDGRRVWMAWTNKPILDDEGQVAEILAVGSDITAQKRAEEAARASESFLNSVIDQSPYPMWISDDRGTLIRANNALRDLLHLSDEEVVGRYNILKDNIVEEQGVLPLVRSVFEKGDTVRFEIKYYSSKLKHIQVRHPTFVILDATIFPITDSRGTVTNAVIQHMDITDRKRAEDALRDSERRYGAFLNSTTDLAFLKDEAFRYVMVNKANQEFFGKTEIEIIGKTDFELMPPSAAENCLRSDVEALGRDGIFVSEEELGGRVFETKKFAVKLENGQIGIGGLIREVTERKKAEESLRKLLDFRQTLIDSIPNPVFYKGVDGKYIDCNEAFAALLGLPKAEVVGRSVYEVASKDLADLWRKKDQELFDGPHVQVFECTLVHPDGTEHSLVFHKAPLFDADGALAGLIGVVMDITDRLRAEEAVRQSEEWYRALVENSFDGIFIQRGPKIIFANSHLYDMLGYSQGELEGMDHWVIYHPEYQEITRERSMARMRGEDVVSQYEVKLQRMDGSTFDGELSARAVKVKGEPGVQVWVRDVSKRKRSEEAQRRLATAVEQVAEAIVITDAQGNIQYVNPACERITGYTREEFIGEKPSLLKRDDYGVALYEKLQETLSRGESWEGRLSKKRKDGTPYEEDVTISPVRDTSGRIINFVGIMRDVTQEVQLQKQLIQAQKMEAVGTLSGGIAHDFNNLLQVTLGYSELLLADKREDDPECADLSKIFQAARSGAELVQRLLTFSRKVEPKPIPLNLNRRILQVEKLLRRTIPKMIDIQLDLSDDLADINADPTQMEQVLMNLALNGRDAMPDRGKLTVGTKNVTLDDEYCRVHAGAKAGEYVLLTVSDTGHGMDKATIDHIFEPFFTTKALGRGTGLGLAMVYGIVKQHGGYISCYSEVEHGTTFNIYLPAIESQAEPEVDKTQVMPAFGTETILLVDDEEFVRDLGARILSKAGYNVLTATNGREALNLFEKEGTQISLVILDLIMPEMGGKECLKGLRKIDPQQKVLIASGLSADPSTKEFVEMGARGFVSKPFKFKELLQQVRKALDVS
jgi:two-component system, cell cycle sensor histidine kinase and response regulator CckA